MIPIGTHGHRYTSKSIWRIALLAFLMGLLVTVPSGSADPGTQVEAASGGAISGRLMVLVSVGVGFNYWVPFAC